MITSDDYTFVSTLIRKNSGVALGAGKEYLVESRLPAVVRTFGFASLTDMLTTLKTRPHHDLVKAVCEAMTTGETFFFRDNVPFDVLRRQVLPEIAMRCHSTGRALRIWCAASSTGQEPYSVAMLLAEATGLLAQVRIEIVASDYAANALNRARRGVFTQLEIQRGLPECLMRKYFTQRSDGYHIADELRRRVSFRELNLIQSFRSIGQFDVVLCRNVLIYFDNVTKTDVLERLSDALFPGGYLFLGSTESAFGLADRIVRLSEIPTSIHVRREDLAVATARLNQAGRGKGMVSPAA